MFNHIMSIISNSGLWALISVLCYVIHEFDPIIEAHLKTKKASARNAHELSLTRAANRIAANLATVAEASPSDRILEGANQLMTYAQERGIKINRKQGVNFVIKAFADYKANGGHIAKAIENAAESVTMNG